MQFILDILFLAVFALSVFIGYHRGFIRTVTGLCTFVISAVLAYLLSPSLGNLIYGPIHSFFDDRVFSYLSSSNMGTDPSALLAALPDELISLFETFGLTKEVLQSQFTSLSASGGDVLREMSRFIAEPIAQAVSHALAYLCIFVVASIVCTVVFRTLDLVAKLPLLNTLNNIGGALFGVLFGLLWVLVLCVALNVLWPMLSLSYPDRFNLEMLNGSLIYRFFAEYFSFGMTMV